MVAEIVAVTGCYCKISVIQFFLWLLKLLRLLVATIWFSSTVFFMVAEIVIVTSCYSLIQFYNFLFMVAWGC